MCPRHELSLLYKSISTDVREGVVRDSTFAVVVIGTLALLVEGVLGLVRSLIFALLYACWKRPSQLDQDPASLNDLMSMIDPRLLGQMIPERDLPAEDSRLAKIVNGKFEPFFDHSIDVGSLPIGPG